MIIPKEEWPSSIVELWADVIQCGYNDCRMTIFGDIIFPQGGSIHILQLSWFNVLEICTVMDEVDWVLDDPAARSGDWLYPKLIKDLSKRNNGMAFHFIKPLGLGGLVEFNNIQQVKISDIHSGIKSLWVEMS